LRAAQLSRPVADEADYSNPSAKMRSAGGSAAVSDPMFRIDSLRMSTAITELSTDALQAWIRAAGTEHLAAVQLRFDHSKLESTARCLGSKWTTRSRYPNRPRR